MTHRERAERYIYKRLGKKVVEKHIISLENEFKRVEEEVRNDQMHKDSRIVAMYRWDLAEMILEQGKEVTIEKETKD